MTFVLDASVALSWHFEDEVSQYATEVLHRLETENGAVPVLWFLELANGLVVAERRGRIDAAGIARAVDLSLTLPLSVSETPAEHILEGVLNLARQSRLTIYDAAYLDLALREAVPLATLDRDLRDAAIQAGVDLIT